MTIIFDTMDPETAKFCGYNSPTEASLGGLRIETGPGRSVITLYGIDGEVTMMGENECKWALDAMAKVCGYKLVKFGEK